MEQYLLGPYFERSSNLIPSSGPIFHHLLEIWDTYKYTDSLKLGARMNGTDLEELVFGVASIWAL
jgi:hypothetical protein